MTEREAGKLDEYARSLELQRPALCVLLVHRELRKKRLGKLRKTASPYPGLKEGVRVTARIADETMKDAFREHLSDVGIKSDEAAFVLFTTELAEKRLYAELAWNGNRG